MKYVDTFKHWSTYFFAFWIELVTCPPQKSVRDELCVKIYVKR